MNSRIIQLVTAPAEWNLEEAQEEDITFEPIDLEALDQEELNYMLTYQLQDFEHDKRRVQNIRKQADLYQELLIENSETFHTYPPRSHSEVSAAYIWATKRGANLSGIQVYNLLFRFKSPKLDGTSTAMMFRDKKKQEYILLLADDTEATLRLEQDTYMEKAVSLIGDGNARRQKEIILDLQENLLELNRNERCTQSLLHEYGHILHYRIFDLFSLERTSERIYWFLESGYFDIINKRIEGFGEVSDEEILYFLKECFAEDVRIYYTQKGKKGKYVLPNAITFNNDLLNPNLQKEGVELVKTIIGNTVHFMENGSGYPQSSGQELDRVKLAHEMAEHHKKYAGAPKITREEMMERLTRLRQKEMEQEAARDSNKYNKLVTTTL